MTASWSYPTPAPIPPSATFRLPAAPWVYVPWIVNVPAEPVTPGLIGTPVLLTLPFTVPVPPSRPPVRVTVLVVDVSVPWARIVLPPDCVSGPETVNVDPPETVIPPALPSAPAVVKLPPSWTVNCPPAAFVVNPASALPLDVLMISEDVPSRTIVAAFVTMLAPANSNWPVPETKYVPPVSVVPEKLLKLPDWYSVLDSTSTVPVLDSAYARIAVPVPVDFSSVPALVKVPPK